jgi:Aldo/keto reductase family
MTTRRDALRFGLATGVAVTGLPAVFSIAASTDKAADLPLITKTIPSTGEKLPAIGLGTDQFRNSEREAIQAEIQRMRQLGGTVVDTAAAYGDSEAVIGDSVATLGIRDRLFLATKLTVNEAGTATRSGEESFTRSLARLKTQRVDLLQVHNLEGVEALMPVLQRWKKEGKYATSASRPRVWANTATWSNTCANIRSTSCRWTTRSPTAMPPRMCCHSRWRSA